MTELTAITLENEMDLTLAYKKSIRTAELLGLTRSTQTAFATAVSEVCREIIDKAFEGLLQLGVSAEDGRFFIVAKAACRIDEFFNRSSEGLEYARKLVPILDVEITGEMLSIAARLSIPRSARVNQGKVNDVKRQLQLEGPMSAYEDIKQRNAALHQLNQQHEVALLHATYLDQKKNEFLSLASHELNSPLTILRSYAQMAVRVNNDKDNEIHRYLKKIDQQSSKLSNLIKQLMDMSRIEDGNVSYQSESVNMREYLQAITEPLQLLVSTHPLTVNPGEDVHVMMDSLRIEQVISNLVSNAAKYSENGKPIHVAASTRDGALIIAVEDGGIGMDKETSHRVFDKFYRGEVAEKKHSGLGMGLYVASRIISDHGGEMSVSSSLGEGSVFTFSLPLSTERAPA